MAGFRLLTLFPLVCFAAFSLVSDCSLTKVSQSHRAAGVFLLPEGGKYTFNFTAARAACLFLNVTMATRAQMERAVQHGLETCKFGWTAEQIAVIPRLTSDQNCGKGKTGLATWSTSTDRKFGVFCFNASDLEETLNRSTVSPQSSTFSSSPTATTRTSTPTEPPLRTTATSPPSTKPRAAEAPERTAFTLPVKKTHSTGVPSTSTSRRTSSTRIPTSLPQLITSEAAVTPSSTSASSSSVRNSNLSVSSEPRSVSPAKPPLGDVPTALIILGIILLLLSAAGVVWYYKLNIFTFWPQGQQKDDIETEMWKHTDSEMDLHSEHEGEEEDEDSDRKYSSDITLCVNPDMKAASLQ